MHGDPAHIGKKAAARKPREVRRGDGGGRGAGPRALGPRAVEVEEAVVERVVVVALACRQPCARATRKARGKASEVRVVEEHRVLEKVQRRAGVRPQRVAEVAEARERVAHDVVEAEGTVVAVVGAGEQVTAPEGRGRVEEQEVLVVPRGPVGEPFGVAAVVSAPHGEEPGVVLPGPCEGLRARGPLVVQRDARHPERRDKAHRVALGTLDRRRFRDREDLAHAGRKHGQARVQRRLDRGALARREPLERPVVGQDHRPQVLDKRPRRCWRCRCPP